MPIIISLLRGINVGGHKKIKMADLRELYESLGLRSTRTILQSGNAVTVTNDQDLSAIAATIEDAIQDTFGFEVKVILRRAQEFRAIFEYPPFDEAEIGQASKLAIVYLAQLPAADALANLKTRISGPEVIRARGKELFITYPEGMARSKLTNQFIERRLGIAATARNWNTSQKILGLLAEFED